jgi:hypothetical protein
MINEIVSSSWDSVQAQASQPTRMQRATPVPGVTTAASGPVRPKPRVSFALQADNRKDGVNGEPINGEALTHDTTSPAVAPARSGTHVDLAPIRMASPTSSSPAAAKPRASAAGPPAPALPTWLELKFVAMERSIRNYKFPRVPQRVLITVATTAAVALLFVGWVSFLLHITRTPAGPATAPPTAPESPAAIPDVTDAAAQPAAMLPNAHRFS